MHEQKDMLYCISYIRMSECEKLERTCKIIVQGRNVELGSRISTEFGFSVHMSSCKLTTSRTSTL